MADANCRLCKLRNNQKSLYIIVENLWNEIKTGNGVQTYLKKHELLPKDMKPIAGRTVLTHFRNEKGNHSDLSIDPLAKTYVPIKREMPNIAATVNILNLDFEKSKVLIDPLKELQKLYTVSAIRLVESLDREKEFETQNIETRKQITEMVKILDVIAKWSQGMGAPEAVRQAEFITATIDTFQDIDDKQVKSVVIQLRKKLKKIGGRVDVNSD